MRFFRFGVAYVLVNIFALLVIAFLAQNARPEHLTYFGISRPVNLALILAGAAIFGFLLCLLLLLPGRIALSFHAWGLDREAEELDQQVAHLRMQREDLLDRFDDLVDGHERFLRRYHQLAAEHREVVADRDRLRAVVGKITAPLATVSEARQEKSETHPLAAREENSAGAGEEKTDSTPPPAPEEKRATAVAIAMEKKAQLARLTRRLLPTAIW